MSDGDGVIDGTGDAVAVAVADGVTDMLGLAEVDAVAVTIGFMGAGTPFLSQHHHPFFPSLVTHDLTLHLPRLKRLRHSIFANRKLLRPSRQMQRQRLNKGGPGRRLIRRDACGVA